MTSKTANDFTSPVVINSTDDLVELINRIKTLLETSGELFDVGIRVGKEFSKQLQYDLDTFVGFANKGYFDPNDPIDISFLPSPPRSATNNIVYASITLDYRHTHVYVSSCTIKQTAMVKAMINIAEDYNRTGSIFIAFSRVAVVGSLVVFALAVCTGVALQPISFTSMKTVTIAGISLISFNLLRMLIDTSRLKRIRLSAVKP